MGSAGCRAPESLVLDLPHLGSACLPAVGGKALNLGQLAGARFPVPSGFCLTTEAYRMAAPEQLESLAAQLDALAPRPGRRWAIWRGAHGRWSSTRVRDPDRRWFPAG